MRMTVLLTILLLLLGGEAFGADLHFGVDVSGAYVPDAKAYSNGKRKEQNFRYHGTRAAAMFHFPFQYKDVKGSVGPYAQQQVLRNNYEETAANGTQGEETITMTGGGIQGILVSQWTGNLHLALALGGAKVDIEQTGDTPKSQSYPFSGEGKLALGVGPMVGVSGVFLRAEYQMVALWNGKSTSGEDEKLRNAWVESLAPVLGFLLAF
jgi:hypothetical protein